MRKWPAAPTTIPELRWNFASHAWQQCSSTPHQAGCLENAFELPPLIVLRDHDVIETAKSALRAQRKLFDRQILRCLVDPPLEQFERLQIGSLGRHQAKHRNFSLRHESQGRKASGALVVVFQ